MQRPDRTSANPSASALYSSCDEDGESNEESEGKDKSDLSSTHLILVEDIPENSGVSVSGNCLLSQNTRRKRSAGSGLEIGRGMKIFKGREGLDLNPVAGLNACTSMPLPEPPNVVDLLNDYTSQSIDDSSENFTQIQGKIRLKSDDSYRRFTNATDAYHLRNKGKTCGSTMKRRKSLDIGVDQTKLSESIFKVFLKREEKIIKKKLVPVGLTQESNRRACEPNLPSSQNDHKPLMEFAAPQAQEGIIIPAQDENDSEYWDRLETHIGQLGSAKTSKPHGILKPAGSKRSVHWEDEVTLIHRCGSTELPRMSGEAEEVKKLLSQKKEDAMSRNEDKWRTWLEGIPLIDKSTSSKEQECKERTKITNETYSFIKDVLAEPDVAAKNSLSHANKSINRFESHQKSASKQRPIISLYESRSSSADTVSREFKRKTRPLVPLKMAASSESFSSSEANPGSKAGIRRRTSSPALASKRDSSANLLLSDTCSAVEIRPREASSPRGTNLDSSRAQDAGRRYQCGEKQFHDESDCRYEEVVVPARGHRSRKDTMREETSFSKHSGRHKISTANAAGTLKDCLKMMETFRNMSPVHLKKKTEILNLIQEIRCNIKSIQDGIDAPPLGGIGKRNIKKNNSDKIKSVKCLKLEKKTSAKNHDKLDKNCKKATSVKSAELLLEEKLYRASQFESFSSPRSPLSESNSKNSGLFRPVHGKSKSILNKWKNTERAISERSERLLVDLRRGREDSGVIEVKDQKYLSRKTSEKSCRSENKSEKQKDEVVKKSSSRVNVDKESGLVNVTSNVSYEHASRSNSHSSVIVSCKGEHGEEITDQHLVSNIDRKESKVSNVVPSSIKENSSKIADEVNSERAPQPSQFSLEENFLNLDKNVPAKTKSVESVSNKFVLVGDPLVSNRNEKIEDEITMLSDKKSNLSIISSESSETDDLSKMTATSSARSEPSPAEYVFRTAVENPPRPPSRKPYFDRDRPQRERDSSGNALALTSVRLDQVENSSTPSGTVALPPPLTSTTESRTRPQPRMYSTLKETQKRTSGICEVAKEQFQTDKRILISKESEKSVSIKQSKSRGSSSGIPWNSSKGKVMERLETKKSITDADIKRVKSKFKKLLCSSSRQEKSESLDRRSSTAKSESPSPLRRIRKDPDVERVPFTYPSKKPSSSGSKVPVRKAAKTEDVLTALEDLAEAAARLKVERPHSAKRESPDARRSRLLPNYAPPWERVNLESQKDERLKNEKRNVSGFRTYTRSHSNPPLRPKGESGNTTPRSLPAGSPRSVTPDFSAQRQGEGRFSIPSKLGNTRCRIDEGDAGCIQQKSANKTNHIKIPTTSRDNIPYQTSSSEADFYSSLSVIKANSKASVALKPSITTQTNPNKLTVDISIVTVYSKNHQRNEVREIEE